MLRFFAWAATICGIIGIAAVLTIPSLLRARISTMRSLETPAYVALYERPPAVAHHTEDYSPITENAFRDTTREPRSTFGIDVDTASYANVRRFLDQGQKPPKDAVRTEELINYFSYDYPESSTGAPVSLTASWTDCPWTPEHRLVQIGVKGRSIAPGAMPPRNLVFLVDVSGSMQDPNKLPLVQSSMRLLVDQLGEDDRVGIVAYAGSAGLVLASTPGSDRARIVSAIDGLHAGGSTAGSEGIELAYALAAQNYIERGVNRVILATDGDFNVGISSRGALAEFIEAKRDSGVFLTALGFGMGNYKDATIEMLADRGNGNYAYVDTFREAEKVLSRELGATLVTVAKDLKLQVEFNPARVAAYRLVGYENRVLAVEDFYDERKDAGELGAGDSVTVLYEIVPAGTASPLPTVAPLKYQHTPELASVASGSELLTIRGRYQLPGDATTVATLERSLGEHDHVEVDDAQFAAAVAAFGMLLRGSEHRGAADFDMVVDLARTRLGRDENGDRAEFLRLVNVARKLM